LAIKAFSRLVLGQAPYCVLIAVLFGTTAGISAPKLSETSDAVAAARVHLMLERSPDPVRILPTAHVQRNEGVFDGGGGGRVVELFDLADIAQLRDPLQQRLHRDPVAFHRDGRCRHDDFEGLCESRG
jgi:hypothetical protein